MSFYSVSTTFSEESCRYYEDFFPHDINDYYVHDLNKSYLEIEDFSCQYRNDFSEAHFRGISSSRHHQRRPAFNTTSFLIQKPVYIEEYLGLECIRDLFSFRIHHDTNDEILYSLRYLFQNTVKNNLMQESSNGYVLDDQLGDFLEIESLFYVESS